MPSNVKNKNVIIIGPTFEQVIDIFYPLLLSMGIENYCISSSRATGVFRFLSNVTLKLVSYESAERQRGKGIYLAVFDECSSYEGAPGLKELWEGIIQPAIRTRWPKLGRAFFISTPKGYNDFYTLYNMQDISQEWKSWTYDYKCSPYLDPKEVETARSTMDPIRFAREYLASFEESGNRVFYCFKRDKHYDKNLSYFQPNEDIHVAIDFNINIMASSACAVRGSQIHWLDDFVGSTDTDELAKMLKVKYKGHKIIAYPDPTGKSRKSSATMGATDFSILRSHGIQVMARDGSPPLVDSVNAVNRQLMTANGIINMYFGPNTLKNLIPSMERTVWKESTPDAATIDKTGNMEHWSDGVRYFTEYMFPIQQIRRRAHMSSSF